MSKGFRLTEDLLCEVIPADVAPLIGSMIISVFVGQNHIYHQTGQVKGVGRGANLVIYHTKGIVCFTKT